MSELHAYTLLVLVGFLPSEIWRLLGLVVARGVADESELFMWVRAVAIAVLAGVIAKIILFPRGRLRACRWSSASPPSSAGSPRS